MKEVLILVKDLTTSKSNMDNKKNRNKRKEIALWSGIPVIIVLALLALVYIFEVLNIHVPGSRDMWIGLIGAVLGGAFTMIGVITTIHKQEEQNEENRRLEYMPILSFKIVEPDRVSKNRNVFGDEPIFDGTLAFINGELCTTAFQFVESKLCKAIEVEVLNEVCVFDFTISGCLIGGKEMHKGECFSPSLQRLVPGEKYRLIFDNDDYSDENVFCLIRFEYKDIWDNKYYQDLPIVYDEIEQEGIIEHSIEIRDVKAPIFVTGDVQSLETAAKKYCDYEVLC